MYTVELIKYGEDKFDLCTEKQVFILSFLQAYQDIPLTELNTDNLVEYLNKAFTQEEENFRKSSQTNLFLHAKDENGKIVGYVAFEIFHEENSAYMRQLAILPEYQKQGIGKMLIESILKEQPDLAKLYLITRKINHAAVKFYERLGFREDSFTMHKFSQEMFLGMSKSFKV